MKEKIEIRERFTPALRLKITVELLRNDLSIIELNSLYSSLETLVLTNPKEESRVRPLLNRISGQLLTKLKQA